jgi:hypothetical protein
VYTACFVQYPVHGVIQSFKCCITVSWSFTAAGELKESYRPLVDDDHQKHCA